MCVCVCVCVCVYVCVGVGVCMSEAGNASTRAKTRRAGVRREEEEERRGQVCIWKQDYGARVNREASTRAGSYFS